MLSSFLWNGLEEVVVEGEGAGSGDQLTKPIPLSGGSGGWDAVPETVTME